MNSASAGCCAAVLCWVLLVTAPAASQVGDAPPVGAQAKASATYVLGADDQVMIHAVDVPEINAKPQRIDPNGDLRLPMIGRVRAAGLTVEQLEAELRKHLGVYLLEPDVAVSVTEFRSRPVSVVGAVASPGVKQLEGSQRLIEVLSAAGGLAPEAGPTVRITRSIDQGRIPLPEAVDDPSGKFSTVEIDARALLEARTPEKNITIQPYDVVSVLRADVVYIIGEVAKPGPVALSTGGGMTLMEAVSSSGGVLRTAAANRVRILRRASGQEARTELTIDLQRIMQARADDVALQSGDILVVPDSSGKRITTRAIEAAIHIGTMIGTYGIVR